MTAHISDRTPFKGDRYIAVQINRLHCTHPECAELLRLREQLAHIGRFDLVNRAERQLAFCAPGGAELKEHPGMALFVS